MPIPVFILNFNGRHLLAECLPSVIEAARRSQHPIEVVVVDTGSADDSRPFLAQTYPSVLVIDRPNLGVASFNTVLRELDCQIAILLSNNVKLAEDCIDRLLAPLVFPAPLANRCFMATPQCRKFDGLTYEGFKAGLQWQWGIVQTTCFYQGNATAIERPGWTARGAPVMAVDRAKFLELGGFDPLFLPGGTSDLDLVFRGYLAGYHARYVPEAVAYHMGSLAPAAIGKDSDYELALTNALLFHWKNLRHPWHLLLHAVGLAARLFAEPLQALQVSRGERWQLIRALRRALVRQRQMSQAPAVRVGLSRFLREWEYARLFRHRRLGRRVQDNSAREAKALRRLVAPIRAVANESLNHAGLGESACA